MKFEVGDVVLGKYRVERVSEYDSFGSSYAVWHQELDKRFALQVIESDDAELSERALPGARAAARIKSEYVARVYDVGTLETGNLYILMEHLDGCRISDKVEQDGRLPIWEALRYLLETCEGVHEAHQLGIVHRDIKPGNLILIQRPDGLPTVKLTGFDLAGVIAGSQVRGRVLADEGKGHIFCTPYFVPPEQIGGRTQIDERADIWALGVTLFNMLTGTYPFCSKEFSKVCGAILRDTPPAPSTFTPEIPPDLDAIILRCLEKEPKDRFQTVTELQSALEAVLGRLTPWQALPESAPIDVFLSYADEDLPFRRDLVVHLAQLQREGKIRRWDLGSVKPGSEWQTESAQKLKAAHLVLVLISPDYLATDYLYQEHLCQAMALRTQEGTQVVPILIRPCDWASTPWKTVRTLPLSGPPIALQPNRDEAWAQVIQQLRELLRGSEEIEQALPTPRRSATTPAQQPHYPNDEARVLSQRIEAARYRKKLLEDAGEDPAEIVREINELRRRLRASGQIKAGDSLGDGRYLLIRSIGRGGFATVFEAADRLHQRPVALKLLDSNLAGDPLRVERFFRGARIMANLKHPHVVRVLESQGHESGWYYFCMEFVPGGDLRRAVLERRVPSQNILPILLRVGDALALAHQQHIVHRDIKPANILLETNGAPKICDFDLVAAADTTGGTRTGALGTFLYAPPEVMEKPQEANARADVFGLGMTGVFAFYGAELPFTLLERKEAFVMALPCATAVKEVLFKAIQSDPDKRFDHAGAFCDALRKAASASDATGGSGPKGWWERIWK